jgi:uncharacterized protein involved in outer membrane biogenesis
MKKVLLIMALLLVVVLAAAFVLPIVFKDDIKAAIDKELATAVNADVVFDVDKFSLSLFSNFPNLTATMEDFGVINRAPFEGNVLFAARRLSVEINLKDVLFGDQVRLKGLWVDEPVINVLVLEDGRANYDITFPDTLTAEAPAAEEAAPFSFGIDHWQITDGYVRYDDRSIPYFLELKGIEHGGSGDFTQDVFDLRTFTYADSVTTGYDGMVFIENKKAEVDATLQISEDYSKYTFKENTAKLNDFTIGFDGWFRMNENDYEMDLSYQSKETSFKSLLSLVPGMYTKDFGQVQTAGNLAFGGTAKGTYSDTQIPAFTLNLQVADAMFKYPDLPAAVSHIAVDLAVNNSDGIIDNTVVDLKKLHLEFGSNPVDARLRIENLKNYPVDAVVNARLNLEELGQMFPMEGLEMKGLYAVNLKAKGIYDSVKQVIPAIDASMSLTDGYVKSADFPMPIENLGFTATVKNTSGEMAETVVDVKGLGLMLDGERFDASFSLQNLNDYTWAAKVKGTLDLGKMTKVYPVEGMTLAGKLFADVETRGKMSDLDAGRYDRLPTKGSASLSQFSYKAADLPYEVTLASSRLVFDPKSIVLTDTRGTIGKSDFAVSGNVSNYFGYMLEENQSLKGELRYSANLLDLNEFMSESEETEAATDTSSYGVVPVPRNIDFVLHSSVKQVKMMDFNLTDARGDVTVRDGIANLNGLHFNMLGGAFTLTGSYDPRDLAHPKYDMGLDIEKVSISEAFKAFTTMKALVPIAGALTGSFSTDFKMTGELNQDLTPNLNTIDANGLVTVIKAAMGKNQLTSGISSLTKLDNLEGSALEDVILSAKIQDGRLSVKPFDVNLGGYKTSVAGSTGVDGTIDYQLKMLVPAGKAGAAFNDFIAKNTGSTPAGNEMVPVNLSLGGLFTSPTFRLISTEQKEQAKQAVTNLAVQEGTKQLQEATKGTEVESLVQGFLGKKDSTATDTTKAQPKTAQDSVAQKLQQDALKKVQNLFKKKKN